MSFAAKFGGTLTGGAAAAGTGYAVYDSSSPKKIEDLLIWKGNKFIEDKDKDAAYQAIWIEQKEEVKREKDVPLKDIQESDAVEKLKTFCDEKKKLVFTESIKDIYDKVEKFCLDKQTKVKGLFTRHGVSFIKENEGEEDYKVIFALYKSQTGNGFIDWVKDGDTSSNISASSSNSDGGTKLKAKCKKELDQNLPTDSFQSKFEEWKKIYWWCSSPGFKTVLEKIKKDEPSKEIETESNNFEAKWEKWKNTTSIITAIKTISGNDDLSANTPKKDAGPKMKTWCDSNKVKQLSEEGIYPSTYINIKSVCIKES